MENPETVGIIGKEKHNTRQKTKEMSNTDPTTNPEGTQIFTKCKQLLSLSYKTSAMLLIYIFLKFIIFFIEIFTFVS
jgi:hypothetical protein